MFFILNFATAFIYFGKKSVKMNKSYRNGAALNGCSVRNKMLVERNNRSFPNCTTPFGVECEGCNALFYPYLNPHAQRNVSLRRVKGKAPALQQKQTEQNGMNVNIKWKNRNEFIGKSEDLLLRRRKQSFRRAEFERCPVVGLE